MRLKFAGEEYYPSCDDSVSCHVPNNLLLDLEPLSQVTTPSTLRFVDAVFTENLARFHYTFGYAGVSGPSNLDLVTHSSG